MKGNQGADSTIIWLGRILLLIIPIVGLIFYIIWAFNNDNLNRRNYARATLILMIIGIVFSLVFGAMSRILFGSILETFMGSLG